MITNTMRLRKTLDELKEARDRNSELSERVRQLEAEVSHLTDNILERCQAAAEPRSEARAESTSGRRTGTALKRKRKTDD